MKIKSIYLALAFIFIGYNIPTFNSKAHAHHPLADCFASFENWYYENWEICKFRNSHGMMIAIYPKNGKFSGLNFEFNKPFSDKLGLINTEDNFSSR